MGSTDPKRLSQQGVEESTEAVERLRSVVNLQHKRSQWTRNRTTTRPF
jgi:hypothetical protein